MILKTIDASYIIAYPSSAICRFKKNHTKTRLVEGAKEGYMVVLERGGRIVGTGTLMGNKITRVYVAVAEQGRGFGKKIMKALEQHARDSGLESVFLNSSIVAKGFYKHVGYTVEAQKSVEMDDGEQLEYFHMVKSLEANPAKSS